jgi:hypothetical protein
VGRRELLFEIRVARGQTHLVPPWLTVDPPSPILSFQPMNNKHNMQPQQADLGSFILMGAGLCHSRCFVLRILIQKESFTVGVECSYDFFLQLPSPTLVLGTTLRDEIQRTAHSN